MPSRAEPSQAEPSQAEPSRAKPSQAKFAYHGLPRLTTAYHGLFIFYLSGKFHEKFVRKISCRAKPSQVCLFIFYLSGKFHEKFVRKISCVFCQENFMKNLLGKFHAELSQQRLASQAKPSLLIYFKFVRKISCVFCQENFMKNLLGKFHAFFVRKIS